MNKITKVLLTLLIAVGFSTTLVQPASAAFYRAYNMAGSKHGMTVYSGSGCTGSGTYVRVGSYKSGTFKSVNSPFKHQISWDHGPFLTLKANQCLTVNANSIIAYVY